MWVLMLWPENTARHERFVLCFLSSIFSWLPPLPEVSEQSSLQRRSQLCIASMLCISITKCGNFITKAPNFCLNISHSLYLLQESKFYDLASIIESSIEMAKNNSLCDLRLLELLLFTVCPYGSMKFSLSTNVNPHSLKEYPVYSSQLHRNC